MKAYGTTGAELSSGVNDSDTKRRAYFSEAAPLVHPIDARTRSFIPSFLSSTGQNFITPADEYNLVYITFWLLGAAFLIPWDSMLSVSDYWDQAIGQNALFGFTISYMMTNLVGLMVLIAVGHRIPFHFRIVPGLIVFIAILIACLFLPKGDSVLANVLMGVFGFCDSVVQGSVYGLAGNFHPRFINAVMAGNGIAGVVISAIQLSILLLAPSDITGFARARFTTVLFFGACIVIIAIAILCYVFLLNRSPVTKYYLSKGSDERTAYVTGDAEGAASQKSSTFAVFKQIWLQGVTVMLVFVVTLALYPGICVLTVKSHSYNFDKIPFPVILITIFNVFDLIGRSLPRFDSLVLVKPKYLWVVAALRLGFIPLMLFEGPLNTIQNDLATYFTIALFALTNGYIGTLAMMYGPADVKPADKETAGTLMVFMLTVGLTAGVWIGNLIGAVTAH